MLTSVYPAHHLMIAGIIWVDCVCFSVCPRLPSLVEYVEQPLTAGLRDRAACVRRVAVLGWAKLHNLQPNSEIGGVDWPFSCFSFPFLLWFALWLALFLFLFPAGNFTSVVHYKNKQFESTKIAHTSIL